MCPREFQHMTRLTGCTTSFPFWWESQHLHGVVIVWHNSRRFSRGGTLKTRIVHIAENSLEPRQHSGWGHRLVGKMAFKTGNEDKGLVVSTKPDTGPRCWNLCRKKPLILVLSFTCQHLRSRSICQALHWVLETGSLLSSSQCTGGTDKDSD